MELGVQSYTIRAYMQNEKDMERSLKRVSEIGYREIQLSAIGKVPASKVRALCDKYHLKIVLTHTAEDRFLYDLDAVLEEHKVYGCPHIGLGSMSERYCSEEGIRYFAEDFTDVAKKIRDAGMRFMYHNHHFEFARLPGGALLMDALLAAMPADLMGVTAETYWLQVAGIDVVQWLRGHADRLQCVHLKDLEVVGRETRMAPVLEGNINFQDILAELKQNGQTKHILVEQDTCYESPFVCLEKSYRNVKKLGY